MQEKVAAAVGASGRNLLSGFASEGDDSCGENAGLGVGHLTRDRVGPRLSEERSSENDSQERGTQTTKNHYAYDWNIRATGQGQGPTGLEVATGTPCSRVRAVTALRDAPDTESSGLAGGSFRSFVSRAAAGGIGIVMTKPEQGPDGAVRQLRRDLGRGHGSGC